MKDKWEKLASILFEILKLYKGLLALGYQKREVLVKRNAQELETIIKQEEKLILHVAKLDELRASVLRQLFLMYGLEDKQMTISQISHLADNDTLQQLKNIEQEFKSLVSEMTQVNEVNKKIVEQARLVANCTLSLLSQSSAAPTYGSNQDVSMVHNRSLFDSKA